MTLRALLLLGCAALSSTFVVQRGPLRLAGSSARVRSGLMVATESDVKITVKPPKAAGEEDASSDVSSNVKIRVRSKTDAAPEAPVAVDDDDSSMTVTVKAPDAPAVVEKPRPKVIRSEAEEMLLNATQGANCTRMLQALQLGANPNIMDPNGRTPLHFCAGVGLAPACMLLIHFGAQLDVRDKEGLTPMHMAAGYANAQTLRVLVMAGADASIPGNAQGTPIEIVTTLGEYQYNEFFKKRKETKNPLEKMKKKDEKLEKLKSCMETLETAEQVLKEADWDAEMEEALKAMSICSL